LEELHAQTASESLRWHVPRFVSLSMSLQIEKLSTATVIDLVTRQ
jgi:hypothetical protein